MIILRIIVTERLLYFVIEKHSADDRESLYDDELGSWREERGEWDVKFEKPTRKPTLSCTPRRLAIYAAPQQHVRVHPLHRRYTANAWTTV